MQLRTKAIGAIIRLIFSLSVLFWLVGCSGGKAVIKQSSPTSSGSPVVSDTGRTNTPPRITVAKEKPKAKPDENWGWIYKEWVNVRSEPNTGSKVVARVMRGEQIKLLQKIGKWWQVELSNKDSAFIYAHLISRQPYLDPWTRFRIGCKRINSGLEVIKSVMPPEDQGKPTAYLTVRDSWIDLDKSKRTKIARQAFEYWTDCIAQSGYKHTRAIVIIQTTAGTKLVKVSTGQAGQKIDVIFYN